VSAFCCLAGEILHPVRGQQDEQPINLIEATRYSAASTNGSVTVNTAPVPSLLASMRPL